MTGAPLLSVVVPTVGRMATLTRVLDRLSDQSAPPGQFELIVAADATVADADSDAVEGLLCDRPYLARRVSAARPGASAARNAGWRTAVAPLILFIDDDILPDAQLISEHLRWHERHPAVEAGVLGHVRWAAELKVTPFMRWLEHGIQFNYASIAGEDAAWGNFYTANASVKRTLVERVGGFDEQRLPYGYEDLDLAFRMHHESGFRLLYNRRASAEHVHAMDLDFWQRRVERIAVAESQFVALHPAVPAYFHDLFTDAARRPPVAPQIERLARVIPRQTPLVGRHVWSRLDLFYRQRLAERFISAWERAEVHGPTPSFGR